MVDLIRRWTGRADKEPDPAKPVLSFGSWDAFPAGDPRVVQVCHPDWRGVRTVAYGFQTPVVECSDLGQWGKGLADEMGAAGIDLVVVQGWPPGAAGFVRQLQDRGIGAKCVLHSSPAQHGAEAGEAAVIDEILGLAAAGILAEVGMAKVGVHEAFAAAGHPVAYVPNRVPRLPELAKTDLGEGLHIGVFAEPFWRKNLPTQLLAAGLLEDSVSHVMRKPDIGYLDGLQVVEHGELAWDEFVSLQGSVDLNLYVTLSECHPSTPQESYLAGVPCLISRVSGVFRSDPLLWDLTTVDEADNPEAIAEGARRLLANREEAVSLARLWMEQADAVAARIWDGFVSS